MQCAIDFDENIPLAEQNVKAWGEMQSLDEEPAYKEEDIKDDNAKKFFLGYKCAMDDVCNSLDSLVSAGELKQKKADEIQKYMAGDLCMCLFSILDDEIEDDEVIEDNGEESGECESPEETPRSQI